MITLFWAVTSIGCSALYVTGDPPASVFLILSALFAYLAWRGR